MAEQFGIEKLKEAVAVIYNSVNTADSTLADGFQVTDLFSILLQLSPLPQVIQAKDDLKNQWKDLSDEEIPVLIAYFNAGLSLKNKELQGRIQKAASAIGAVAIAIRAFSKKEIAAIENPA